MRSTLFFFILFYAVINNAFAESYWQSAANRYGIHETILRAIALTESAMDSQVINRNTNGSVNIGLMQINSRWFFSLAEIGIKPGDLWNPCTNIHVGATPELLQGRDEDRAGYWFHIGFSEGAEYRVYTRLKKIQCGNNRQARSCGACESFRLSTGGRSPSFRLHLASSRRIPRWPCSVCSS